MPAKHRAEKAGGRVRAWPRLSLGVGASSESEALRMLAQPYAPLSPHTTGEMHIPVAANITHTWDFSTEIPSGLAYLLCDVREQRAGTSGNNEFPAKLEISTNFQTKIISFIFLSFFSFFLTASRKSVWKVLLRFKVVQLQPWHRHKPCVKQFPS